MSLIDKGHNEMADQIYHEVVENGKTPTTTDTIVLAQEIVRLTKQLETKQLEGANEETFTEREINLVREAVARTRYELGDRAAAPGSQDWQRQGQYKVTPEEGREIRDYVRHVRNQQGPYPAWIKTRKAAA
jgi:hypothetical protein